MVGKRNPGIRCFSYPHNALCWSSFSLQLQRLQRLSTVAAGQREMNPDVEQSFVEGSGEGPADFSYRYRGEAFAQRLASHVFQLTRRSQVPGQAQHCARHVPDKAGRKIRSPTFPSKRF